MKKISAKIFSLLVVSALLLQLSSCGTILHPERQGQPKGDIDPAIAILDGVGLLFFIIPGLVAFAIDFHTGAIYLPRGRAALDRINELEQDGLKVEIENGQTVVYFDRDRLTPEQAEQIIRDVTDTPFTLDDPQLETYRLDGSTRLHESFARYAIAGEKSTLRLY